MTSISGLVVAVEEDIFKAGTKGEAEAGEYVVVAKFDREEDVGTKPVERANKERNTRRVDKMRCIMMEFFCFFSKGTMLENKFILAEQDKQKIGDKYTTHWPFVS